MTRSVLDSSGSDRPLLADQLFARMRAGASRNEAADALGLAHGAARRMTRAYWRRRELVHVETDESIRAAPTSPTLPVVPRPLPLSPIFTTRQEIVSFWDAALCAAHWCEIDGVSAARLAALRAWDLAHPIVVFAPLPRRPLSEAEIRAAKEHQRGEDEAEDLLHGRRLRGRFPGMND